MTLESSHNQFVDSPNPRDKFQPVATPSIEDSSEDFVKEIKPLLVNEHKGKTKSKCPIVTLALLLVFIMILILLVVGFILCYHFLKN